MENIPAVTNVLVRFTQSTAKIFQFNHLSSRQSYNDGSSPTSSININFSLVINYSVIIWIELELNVSVN